MLLKTDSSNIDFINLVQLLDADLTIGDGDDHDFYHQFNYIDTLKNVIVLYNNNQAVACGAFKSYTKTIAEIKRIYVLPEHRGLGFASTILLALEQWCLELDFEKCILETGIMQPEAIALYKKNNYNIIENYGQYAGVINSVCFEKILQ
jgi:putative acetyltransferase